eukprot:m.215561 g.215561  ORF g.215561 m.215561 type:complete len:307 (+) comp19103_c0_seq1:92-1012(+)
MAKLSCSPMVALLETEAKEEEEERILIAVPKKGRLAASVDEILVGAGLSYTRPNRLDVARCKRVPVTIVFLPAADIARFVGEGNVDMGVTGLDIIAECEADVEILDELGMGKCKLAVQAPVGQYKSVEELAGKRICTSFPNLARKYFEKFDQYGDDTRIKYVSGSVEVACALGLADAVVDLVETGTTMRAAGLEIVGKVMDTETVLIKNKHTKHAALVERIHKRIKGYMLSQKSSMMTYNIRRKDLAAAEKITPGAESPTLSPLENEEWISVTVLVRTEEVSDVMDKLQEIGARSLVVFKVDNCRF